jgi:RNA polymerase sigma factor (sigma-70 family)
MDHTLADAKAQHTQLEAAFIAALPDIERVSRHVARRHRLTPSETDDFCSEVSLNIIEDNYAVLASFQGRSSLRTYLTTVIQRLFLDYRRRLWGKWRPSAEATRRGPLAVRLEILLHRDGLSFDEALETLRTNFACEEARDTLSAMANAFPPRTSRRPVNEAAEEFATVPASVVNHPDSQFEGGETGVRVQSAIDAAMIALEAVDRIVLRMRFEDDVSVADIARALHLDQKKLYRRIEELLKGFRNSMEEKGLAWDDVRAMIERGQCHLVLPKLPAETRGAGPSLREVQA